MLLNMILRFLITIKVYSLLLFSLLEPGWFFSSEKKRIRWSIGACYNDAFLLEKWCFLYKFIRCKKEVYYKGKKIIGKNYVCGLINS